MYFVFFILPSVLVGMALGVKVQDSNFYCWYIFHLLSFRKPYSQPTTVPYEKANNWLVTDFYFVWKKVFSISGFIS